MRYSLFFALCILLVGCSTNEVLEISQVEEQTLTKDQIEISTTKIENNDDIKQVKELFDDLEVAAKPDYIDKKQPDLLVNIGENFGANVWVEVDRSAIILKEDNNYYAISKEKVDFIKSLLD
ncbi:putative periplasmic lipoprotein [Rossellomorea aquimaris]|uniref:hypothetical protein n=1 Tax=Rossellomorea aquimaris TaxID=189382 RepID=UPI0007D0945C|nr:hypothetical protein [Rossellomorea aquimaris]